MGLPVPGNRKVGASLCVVTNVEMAFIFKTGRQLLLSSESVVFPSVACKYTLGLITSVCWCFSISQLKHPEPKETLENMKLRSLN